MQIISGDGFLPTAILQKVVAKLVRTMSDEVWGYARVSDDSQSLNLQLDALKRAGIERRMIFTDQLSGARSDRPGLDALLHEITPGQTLCVWRLDRLGRSVSHLVGLLEDFGHRGIMFKSLTEAIDTRTPSGRMIFGVLAALASYERELTVERVRAGMRAAAARNIHLGRPRSLSWPQRALARQLRSEGQSLKQIAAIFEVHPATISRCITHQQCANEPIGPSLKVT